jgi:hypothetical protein
MLPRKITTMAPRQNQGMVFIYVSVSRVKQKDKRFPKSYERTYLVVCCIVATRRQLAAVTKEEKVDDEDAGLVELAACSHLAKSYYRRSIYQLL